MQRYFSPSTGGFYSDQVNGPRQVAAALTPKEIKAGKRPAMIENPDCTLPADAMPIAEDRFQTLMAAQASGQQIIVSGGKPVAIDRAIDDAAVAAARQRARDRKLAASDWTQLPDSPLDAATRQAWAQYRQALRDLDMSGTDWPAEPEF